KETTERCFADAKELHGRRCARMRGLARVTEQCLHTPLCQNIKKMALLLWKRNNGPQGGPFIRLFFSILFQLAYKPSGFSAGFVNSLKLLGKEQLLSSFFHLDRFRRASLLGIPYIVPKLLRDIRRSRVIIQDDVGDSVFIVVVYVRCGRSTGSAGDACILIYPCSHG